MTLNKVYLMCNSHRESGDTYPPKHEVCPLSHQMPPNAFSMCSLNLSASCWFISTNNSECNSCMCRVSDHAPFTNNCSLIDTDYTGKTVCLNCSIAQYKYCYQPLWLMGVCQFSFSFLPCLLVIFIDLCYPLMQDGRKFPALEQHNFCTFECHWPDYCTHN